MNWENTLQMYPLLRIVPPMCIGIILGYAVMPDVSFGVWLAAAFAAVAMTKLLHRHRICQSAALYITVLILGGTLVRGELDGVDIELPHGPMFYQAVVASSPVEAGKTVRCDLVIVDAPRPFKIRASFYKDGHTQGLGVGDGVEAYSLLERPRNMAGGNFDYAAYLRCHGFSATTFIYKKCWRKASVGMSCLSRLERTRIAALRLRSMLLGKYADYGMGGQQLAVVSAVTMGDKSLLSGDTRKVYSTAGASHVLALSGLHLSMICSFLCLFAGRFRRTVLFLALLVVGIWSFTFIVGMSPSVMRAAVMLTVYMFCERLNREETPLNALAFAALVLLVISPLSLYDVGFQMSFMAMLSIFLLYKPVYYVFPLWARNFCVTRWIIGMTAVSVAAQVGVAPLTAYYFGQLPCYFFITNIVVVPLIMVIVGGSILFFILSFSTFLQSFAAHCLSAAAGMVNTVVTGISSLPGASITELTPSAFQVLMAYALIFALYVLCGYLRRVSTLFPAGSEP